MAVGCQLWATGGLRPASFSITTAVVRQNFKETNYIGVLEVDYNWVMKKGFQLYSGAGFGVRVRKGTYNDQDSTETVSKALPTFHVNLLGFRIGRKVGIFGEGGFAYKGMFCAGLNAQF